MMDRTNHNVAPSLSGQTDQLYSAYKDRLMLLGRIDNLERFAVPNLRARYQRQALLVQLGQGNPRKVENLAQELEAAEKDIQILKKRLKAL